jgi:hypothetical protein
MLVVARRGHRLDHDGPQPRCKRQRRCHRGSNGRNLFLVFGLSFGPVQPDLRFKRGDQIGKGASPNVLPDNFAVHPPGTAEIGSCPLFIPTH